MSSNQDYGHLLAMVGQLQAQLQKRHTEKQQPVEPAEGLDGVAWDEDQECEADAEEILSAQSEVSAEAEKKKKETDSKEAALQRLRSTHNLNAAPSAAAPASTASMPALPDANPASMPSMPALPHANQAPSADAARAPPPEVNSKTHKKEYMRLVPWIAGSTVQVVATLSWIAWFSFKGRLMNNGTITATSYPSMHALANGTTKELKL